MITDSLVPAFIDQGACSSHDPRYWDTMTRSGVTSRLGHVRIGNQVISRYAQIAMAQSICSGCPVREECLGYIKANPNPEGIWAGTMPDERSSW